MFTWTSLFSEYDLPKLIYLMKTASLGLLEVPVVRVNDGGDAPPDPPSIGDVTGHSPFLCFLQEQFFGVSGNIFLAD